MVTLEVVQGTWDDLYAAAAAQENPRVAYLHRQLLRMAQMFAEVVPAAYWRDRAAWDRWCRWSSEADAVCSMYTAGILSVAELGQGLQWLAAKVKADVAVWRGDVPL